MTTEIQDQLTAIMQQLSDAKLPAIFIIAEPDQLTTVKNANDRVTSELFIEYLNGSEDRQNVFLEKLEECVVNKDSSTEQMASTEKDNK